MNEMNGKKLVNGGNPLDETFHCNETATFHGCGACSLFLSGSWSCCGGLKVFDIIYFI
jgi:hypothetical protein